VFVLVAPNTEGTYSQLNKRFHSPNTVAEFLNQDINIVTSPIRFVGKCRSIFGKGQAIRKIKILDFVRIEIVVKMNGINFILIHYLHDDIYYMLHCLWQTRIEIEIVSIL